MGKSHHIINSVDFQCYLEINSSKSYKYNYGRGDYQSITCELLNIDWTTMFNGLDIDTTCMVPIPLHMMLQLIDKYVPTSSIKGPRPMWMNSTALKSVNSVKQKRKAWMKYKATRLRSDFIAYTKYRNLSTDAVRNAKFEFEKTYLHKSKLTAIHFGSMLGAVQRSNKMLEYSSVVMDRLLRQIMRLLMS